VRRAARKPTSELRGRLFAFLGFRSAAPATQREPVAWTAGQQGADGAGHYAATSGNPNDVISIAPTDVGVSGVNFTIGGGPSYGATLRLAQVP